MPASQVPLAIERVERARAAHDQVRLRLTGRWRAGADTGAAGSEALLVVQLHGRRHRFPAVRGDDDGGARPQNLPFTASFTIPDWAVPEQPGQAVLWVGDVVVPVPAPGTTPVTGPPPPVPAPAPPPAPSSPAPEDSAADLERRRAAHSDLESVHAELRGELGRLTAAVGEQREEFVMLGEQLAAAHVARDAALGEAGALRTELDRLASELAALREQHEGAGGDLSEAQQLLADARALTEQLRVASIG